MLREAREFGVELHLHARGEKAEAFEQPLDIRVGAFEAFQPEAPGDLRKLLRELAAHLAQVLKFLAVVAQKFAGSSFSAARPRRRPAPRRARGRDRCEGRGARDTAAPTNRPSMSNDDRVVARGGLAGRDGAHPHRLADQARLEGADRVGASRVRSARRRCSTRSCPRCPGSRSSAPKSRRADRRCRSCADGQAGRVEAATQGRAARSGAARASTARAARAARAFTSGSSSVSRSSSDGCSLSSRGAGQP